MSHKSPSRRLHRLPVARVQIEVLAVRLEVVDDLLAAGVARIALRHRKPGKPRQTARGMKVQSLVVVAPRVANVLVLLEQDSVDPSGLERRGDS